MLPVRRDEVRPGWPSKLIAKSPHELRAALAHCYKRGEITWAGRIERTDLTRWEVRVWRVKDPRPTPWWKKPWVGTLTFLAVVGGIFAGVIWAIDALLDLIERHWPGVVGGTAVVVVLLLILFSLGGGGGGSCTIKVTHHRH